MEKESYKISKTAKNHVDSVMKRNKNVLERLAKM
jgi:hypothetical protein